MSAGLTVRGHRQQIGAPEPLALFVADAVRVHDACDLTPMTWLCRAEDNDDTVPEIAYGALPDRSDRLARAYDILFEVIAAQAKHSETRPEGDFVGV